jgi:Zn-dependent protease
MLNRCRGHVQNKSPKPPASTNGLPNGNLTGMDANTSNVIVDGLITYLGLVILLTFHEFGHAWTASKCGDDTARLLGRVSLNPIVHIDPIGTVLMPLLMLFVSPNISRFMIGWAKPVPVNLLNLRQPNRDDILITMAGPVMNLILAVALMALVRVGLLVHLEQLADVCLRFASLSLLLCFFNLIPIPPLDGSRVMRVLTGMSYEAYWHLAQFGFIAVILVIQIPQVGQVLRFAVDGTLLSLAAVFGIPLQ